jgi:putative Holliday junction resolvase
VRFLAIDFGSRRVGLALSDEGGKFASPLEVLQVSSPRHAAEQAARAAKEQGAERLVIGLPLNMDDTAGPAARSTASWGQSLGQLCGLPVIFVDERLSSFDAEGAIVDRKRAGEKITRKQKKTRLDALAAAGFLQSYLDGRIGEIDVSRF